MAITAFSNLTLRVSNGGTVPSLDYLDTETYVNIGSGNVLKLSWNTPTAANNAVDSYTVTILVYDSLSTSYGLLYRANVGNVNEFFVKASLFDAIPQSFITLRIYVYANSRYGATYSCTSNTEQVNVSRGCGTYTKVASAYSAHIMKRSLAFTKLNFIELVAADGTPITDTHGNALFGKASSMQDSHTGWALMQEFLLKCPDLLVLADINGTELLDNSGLLMYAKGTDTTWAPSDIRYEVLTDSNGEVITDINNQSIFVL